ncbi:glycosyltransferase family 2 protein [Candidatus Microgenomates bacterium]|nr:MAG: glycosyltransferase family 2 protein [Candidatus Microgenomates bacterium]
MAKKLGVSIAICSHNSEQVIEKTLLHLSKQKTSPGRKWEILLIDNKSTDQTTKKVKNLMSINLILKSKIRIIKENKLGISNARLKALISSNYEIISFIDDDNWVTPNWVEKAATIMENQPSFAVCGGHNRAPKLDNKPAWFEKYKECYAIGKQGIKTGDITSERGFVWGAGMSIRKKAWEEINQKGFKFFLTGRIGNTRSAGEDSELCFALRLTGWKIWYDEELVLTHDIDTKRLNWRELRKMFRGFGVGRAGHDPYFFAEQPSKFSQHWYIQALIVLIGILKKANKFVVSRLRLMEGDADVLKIEHMIGHLYFLLSERGKFDKRTNYLRINL